VGGHALQFSNGGAVPDVLGYIEAGVTAEARLLVDGRGQTVAGREEGFFLGGSLFDQVTPQISIYPTFPAICWLN
jgi:acyl-CoA reductase-like NAD-dependent aldehyde dehydrogenase